MSARAVMLPVLLIVLEFNSAALANQGDLPGRRQGGGTRYADLPVVLF